VISEIRLTPLAGSRLLFLVRIRERRGFSRAHIFVLLGCWVGTYRSAILCGHRDSSEPAFARIAKDRAPRTIQGAEPRLGTSLIVSDSSGTAVTIAGATFKS
jgi:hypothetical protein